MNPASPFHVYLYYRAETILHQTVTEKAHQGPPKPSLPQSVFGCVLQADVIMTEDPVMITVIFQTFYYFTSQ